MTDRTPRLAPTASRTPGAIAARLAQTHRPTALARGDAVVVGNRAGVVEWTGEGFCRLTGFPLLETLGKPITHFLDHAGLELELVDFVAQHFLEGRVCTVELPFETFDGRSIQVHLEVEPLRERDGEVTRFIAVASDVSDRPAGKPTPKDSRPEENGALRDEVSTDRRIAPSRDARRHADPEAPPISLDPIIAEACRRITETATSEIILETILEARLPGIPGDAISWQTLFDSLFESALVESDRRPTFLTVVTGRLPPGRSHISLVHPVPARAIPSSTDWRSYLEVHDTAPHLPRDLPQRIQAEALGRTRRERKLGDAARLAGRLGLSFHLDSTPGCGTQVLLLMPGFAPGGDQAMYMPPLAAKI